MTRLLTPIRSLAIALFLVTGCITAPHTAVRAPSWFRGVERPQVIAVLPMDTDAATADWDVSEGFALVQDDILAEPVWEHTGGSYGWMRSKADLPGSYAVEARVRVMERGRSATLAIGTEGPAPTPQMHYALTIRPSSDRAWSISARRTVQDHYLEDRGLVGYGPIRTLREAVNTIPGQSTFGERYPNPPSPLSDDAYRREIEAVLAARPNATEQWMDLRIEYRPARISMSVNGTPVGERSPAGRIGGDVFLQLFSSMRIARLEIQPLSAPSAFVSVPLTERLNSHVDIVLPSPNEDGQVSGVPFRFAQNADGQNHVDLGESLFRQRNRSGHFMAGGGRPDRVTWPSPNSMDPARIMMTVPNRAYTRLWLIAAFDEEPYSTPTLTVRFFKPLRGFAIDTSCTIPGFTASSAPGAAKRLRTDHADGSNASLWLVPIELDAARIGSEMRDVPTLAMELTKAVYPYRGYPDPANYDWFQGGLPCGVRVFAATLETAPVRVFSSGNRFGNVYVTPEQPLWHVDLLNQRPTPVSGHVRLHITDPYGSPAGTVNHDFSLPASGQSRLGIPLAPTSNGLHTVHTEVRIDDPLSGKRINMGRLGTFVQLPLDTRQATTENSPWGLFSWGGGHGTHAVPEDCMYLLRASGARYGPHSLDVETSKEWGLLSQTRHIGNDQRSAQPWAFEDPYDPEKYAENADQIGKRIAGYLEKDPVAPSFAMYIETAITYPLTYGLPRKFLGEDPTLTEEEARRVKAFKIYGQAVCEGIREHAPDAKIALGWADANMTVPLLAADFPRELFDYIGVDVPVFERTPEMPVREVTANRMWLLAQGKKEYGYEDVPVIHSESLYPSSHPLALGWRRSADHCVRLSVLSLAMLPKTTFVGVFCLQDAGSYWGSQHYGEHGLIGREPEANPKPAFSAYATMTRLLDPGEYQGYVPTGSHSAYCLHFTSHERNVYPMWTVRGQREARIRLPDGSTAVMVDEAGNEFPLSFEDGWASVTLSPTPLWVTSDAAIQQVTLGTTDHAYVHRQHPIMRASFPHTLANRPEDGVSPGDHAIVLDALGTAWTYVPGAYPPHAEGHWAMSRHAGPMRSEIVQDETRNAPVWQITLEKPEVTRELTAWYGVFEPPAPIAIPGKARALGVWADGRSNWGRIVYELMDAEGETWRSIGTRDDWNCDDTHTWSFFNYDGWRYIEFPLPSHQPGDDYREHETVWWGSDGGDGVVQLPLTLQKVIVEQRTHNIYAHDLVEVPDRSVRLHNLTAVYDDAESMSDAPVALQRATAGLLQWDTEGAPLPNPIADLRENGPGAPTAFEKLAPPDDYDGLVTKLDISLRPIEGAKEYRVYVAAYEDGRGATRIAQGAEPKLTVSRLQPKFPLYLFATYTDADGKESRPTPHRRILLVDDFPFK